MCFYRVHLLRPLHYNCSSKSCYINNADISAVGRVQLWQEECLPATVCCQQSLESCSIVACKYVCFVLVYILHLLYVICIFFLYIINKHYILNEHGFEWCVCYLYFFLCIINKYYIVN